MRLVCQAVKFVLNRFGEDIFYEIARAAASQAGDIPDAIAREDGIDEGERKRRYIDFVVDRAPTLLREHGGVMAKTDLRNALRRFYTIERPIDEANAYGWAFRRLTEADVIEPASGRVVYELRAEKPSGSKPAAAAK